MSDTAQVFAGFEKCLFNNFSIMLQLITLILLLHHHEIVFTETRLNVHAAYMHLLLLLCRHHVELKEFIARAGLLE